jgi:hypothetical protein
VLKRHAAGADPAEIAAELFLSHGMVRSYLASAVTSEQITGSLSSRLLPDGQVRIRCGWSSRGDDGEATVACWIGLKPGE